MADAIDTMKPVHFENETEPVIHDEPQITHKDTTSTSMTRTNRSPLVLKMLLPLVIVLAGIGTGYLASQVGGGNTTPTQTNTPPANSTDITAGSVYGNKDVNKYKDSAEGVLVHGGASGEGSHHLLRLGGPTKNVYLTSSEMDLSVFENHKVKVWGETFASQNAGWLMDVGRVEVLELNAEKPFEEPSTTDITE